MKLELKNLNKTYKNGVKALDDFSLTINAGMFGLLGPNGAGKSTLMRTIATLQDADEGEVFFNDIDVFKQPYDLKKKLGYLPQEFGVYPNISALKLLNHIAILKGITNRKDRKDIVTYLLNKVNLYEKRNKYVSGFSGGMKQRFGIALALIGNPDLIIVDEPTAGLDPAERVRFNNMLSEISEDKIVILSTHIVDDVSDLCNDMAIMNDGKLIVSGKPSEIISGFDNKIWEKLITKDQLKEYEEEYHIVYSQLKENKPLIHVYSEQPLNNGFRKISPELNDVYFMSINNN